MLSKNGRPHFGTGPATRKNICVGQNLWDSHHFWIIVSSGWLRCCNLIFLCLEPWTTCFGSRWSQHMAPLDKVEIPQLLSSSRVAWEVRIWDYRQINSFGFVSGVLRGTKVLRGPSPHNLQSIINLSFWTITVLALGLAKTSRTRSFTSFRTFPKLTRQVPLPCPVPLAPLATPQSSQWTQRDSGHGEMTIPFSGPAPTIPMWRIYSIPQTLLRQCSIPGWYNFFYG